MERRRFEGLRLAALGAVFALALASCGGGSSDAGGGSAPPPTPPEPEEPRPEPTPPPGEPQARLDRVEGCEPLTEALRADASAKIAVQADELRSSGWSADEFAGPPAPTAPDPEGAPRDFTDTNVQVEGVDEADIVETDGQRIYLLHGSSFVVVDAWPPVDAALESETEIEGFPEAMFVAEGRAVVFSTVYDEVGRFGDIGDCRFIGPPTPFVDPALVGDIAPCAPAVTKVTVLDATAAPVVTREVYLEGIFTTARRHESIVRLVVQGGHGLPDGVPDFWTELYSDAPPQTDEEFRARVDAWEQAALAAIEQSELGDWLPGQWAVRDGVLEVLPPLCSEVHLPPAGRSAHGMTRILALDMTADGGELHDALIVGHASDVYASLDRLVLAQRDWEIAEDGDRTAIHLFEVGATTLATAYLGSGYVPGVPHGQFSFDMREDVLRVATTRTGRLAGSDELRTTSRIVTTRLVDGALETLGSTGDLAPDERIFAVRYVGDRGYLVTFRQIDPLFVVDLSDPAQPTVLGELELPGFSEYMHPLGDDHLLTIGQDADEEGRVLGLALRIFDVSDDANPTLAHLYRFGEQGWSAANHDHRAFIFDPARGLLTFPYVAYEGPYRSVLELFSVDAASGFTPLGEVDHTDLTESRCGLPDQWQCPYSAEIRRGLFIDDFLFSISAAGVRAHAADDLSAPVSTVVLPAQPGAGLPLPEVLE